MIRAREATMLAFTKLRTRKVRLVVTIIISGLLFSVLAAASIAARGTFASVASFSSEGLSDRYIAQATPFNQQATLFMNPEIIDRAVAINKDIVARKKAEAKRLGLEYNAEDDSQPVDSYPGPNGKSRQSLNPTHPASIQAAQEYLASHTQLAAGVPELKHQAQAYNAQRYYESRVIPYGIDGALQVLKGGKESYDTDKNTSMGGPSSGIDSFGTSWTLMSKDLLKPFILPGQNLERGSDGSIPIIIPISAAEQLTGMKALGSSATSADRLERTKELRTAAKDINFEVCYRNAASLQYVQDAVSAQQEIERNKNKKDYRKPDLQYGLPESACSATTVVRDVRTKEQKAVDAKQQEYDRLFGASEPATAIMRFRVVGLVPDADYDMSTNVTQIIKSLVTSSLGNGWYAPVEAATQDTTVKQLFYGSTSPFNPAYPTYYAEFDRAADARRFIDEQHCEPNYRNYDPQSGDDPAQHCIDAGTLFAVQPFGSNSLGLESVQRGFSRIFTLVGLGIAIVAALIMMGTVGKMIADSRRETAVFRAIGAKKLDIAQIYVLYTIFLSLLITAFAVAIGLLAAMGAHMQWSPQVTQEALIAYNAQDLSKVFRLYGFHLPDMLYLLGIAVVAGLLSALFPLIRNLRRNPIRDMRDDT